MQRIEIWLEKSAPSSRILCDWWWRGKKREAALSISLLLDFRQCPSPIPSSFVGKEKNFGA